MDILKNIDFFTLIKINDFLNFSKSIIRLQNFIGSFEMSLGIARLSSVTPCIEHENLVNDL